MAKILYGVYGQGAGHSYRSKEIIAHLLEEGHVVKVVAHNTAYKNLKPIFDVIEVAGYKLFYKNNRAQYTKTFLKNALNLKKLQESVKKVKSIIKKFKPDVIISDFETNTILAGLLMKIPIISIDNQHQITNTKIKVLLFHKKSLATAKIIIKLLAPSANEYLITSFYKTPINTKNTYLFPPVLAREVRSLKQKSKNYIFVYVTSEFDKIIPVLQSLDEKAIVYGFRINKVIGNIEFKEPSRAGLLNALANCSFVISNSGMTLLGEALYLHKPVLAIPVHTQYEQILNAYYLEKLGYGKSIKNLSKKAIMQFKKELPTYKNNLKKYKREDNSALFTKLDELIEKYTTLQNGLP